jgi:hypothetical protein
MNRRFVPNLLLCGLAAMPGCARPSNVHPATKPRTLAANLLPSQPGSYAQEIAAAKREGVPIGPQALQAPLPPPEQNAAALYTQMILLRKTRPLSQEDDGAIAAVAGHKMPSAEQWTQARLVLQHRPDLLRLIHQVAARPQCVFTRDWSNPNAILSPELAQMREAVRLLTAESLLLAQNGKPLEAVRNEALGFRIAHHADEENWLIGYLTAINSDAITLNSMEKILTMAGNDPAVADAVQKEIEKAWTPPDLIHSLRSEAGIQVGEVEMLRKLGPASLGQFAGDSSPDAATLHMNPQAWNAFLDANGAYMLHQMRTSINAAKRPFLEATPILRSLDAQTMQGKSLTHLLAVIILPQFALGAEKRASIQALADTVRAAAAVLAWKARHGAFPATLAQALTTVPTDPFDGKPLRYRQEGTGFVLYSVGKDGTFDGGTPDKQPSSRDVVFRYPLPPYYQAAFRAKPGSSPAR